MATDDSPTDLDAESDPGTDADGEPESVPAEPDSTPSLSETELEALHEVELGLEWTQRAQGCLLEFHHATGHGMDHLARGEELLRAAGRDDLADAIRTDLLPHGVVDEDRWSYDVLEDFQETLLAETRTLERRVRRELADGERHVRERRQERTWKRRARER
ncbi:hypothetical protein [Natrinema salifodinae]|uniref:Uncharacterized protein n=1 Tax=Natrinema salifodinae TaxID=1202768 RepID=A0A1I0PG97_9EURY|nr:hypothetical protein [Natrinema salifodinae]SEW13383.1 hypothetical protein SAMN05216285_2536 [Natrinema salifodinae]